MSHNSLHLHQFLRWQWDVSSYSSCIKRASVVRHLRCGSGGLGTVEPGGRGGGGGGGGGVGWLWIFWVRSVVWGLGFVGYMGEIERGKMTRQLDDAKGGEGLVWVVWSVSSVWVVGGGY